MSATRLAHTRSGRRAARNIRRGFTLIEMIVAIMVFGVGVLSLAAGAGLVATTLGSAAQQTRVANIVQSRFDKLRVTACTTLSSGSEGNRGVLESWTVTEIPRARRVTVVAQFYRDHRLKTQNFEMSVPC